jgi:cytochrome P450/NADPH-cytochrome P450 reductase
VIEPSREQKTGRSQTNGGTMDATAQEPWNAVHDALSKARVERLPAGHSFERGSVGECPFMANIIARKAISEENDPRTRQVVLDLPDGLTWNAGDRLMTIVPNAPSEVEATCKALRRAPTERIRLSAQWCTFFKHASKTLKGSAAMDSDGRLPLGEVVRFSTLRPLSFNNVKALREALSHVARIDAIDELLHHRPVWPVPYTVAGLICSAIPDSQPFELSDGTVCELLSPQKIRTYSISNACPFANRQGAAEVQLTVTRQDFNNKLRGGAEKFGVSSGYLNPSADAEVGPESSIMVGLQPPLNFSLPELTTPIVMLAAGSGLGPMRAFWQAREQQSKANRFQSEDWLLFGCQSESSLLYREEMSQLLQSNHSKFVPYITFSREKSKRVEFDTDGLRIEEGATRGRYVADMIMQDTILSSSLLDLLLPQQMGGRGACFYVCGSVPFYTGLMAALRSTIAKNGADGH